MKSRIWKKFLKQKPTFKEKHRAKNIFSIGDWISFKEGEGSQKRYLVLESNEYTTEVYNPYIKKVISYYTDDMTLA